MRRLVPALFATALAVTISASCKPKPGDECKGDAKECDSPTSHLVCLGGHYVAETCKGPKKCAVEDGKVACDASRADIGDPCATTNKSVCTSDAKARVKCESGKYAFVTHCGGVENCTSDDNGDAFCSHPYADEGDPCKEGEGACSNDQTFDLACQGGKMAKNHVCRGEEKCTPRSSGPVCDRSVALVGEPCDEKDPELAVACAPDLASILVCKGVKLAQGPTCRGEFKCGVARYGKDGRRHFQSECDQSIGDVGEECLKDLKAACSSDLKVRLMCQAGKFVEDKKCKKGCDVNSIPMRFMCKEDVEPPPGAPTAPKKK